MARKKNSTEIERRWYIRSIHRARIPKATKVWHILQGFLEIRDSIQSTRVRLVTNGKRRASMAVKRGKGRVRYEVDRRIDWDLAQALMQDCRLRIEKTRSFIPGGWELDSFHGPLQGIVLLECELPTTDTPVTLPSWVRDAIEVTEFLTSRDLARLALKLQRNSTSARAAVERIIATHNAGR
jgi:CYTH domain-containing protein